MIAGIWVDGQKYEESLQKVLPLKERLARTNALIDQMVYRLYGLTEEVGVVEGKAGIHMALKRAI